MVRCSECGFIAARVWRTREFVEIEDRQRDSGDIKNELGGGLESIPVCFVNSFDIKEEVEAVRKAAHDEPTQNAFDEQRPPRWAIHVKQVLNTERDCKWFIKWQQGSTPKEHREMMDRQFMMEMEEKRRKNDRKWHWIEIGIIIIVTALVNYLIWILTGH